MTYKSTVNKLKSKIVLTSAFVFSDNAYLTI